MSSLNRREKKIALFKIETAGSKFQQYAENRILYAWPEDLANHNILTNSSNMWYGQGNYNLYVITHKSINMAIHNPNDQHSPLSICC